MTKIEERYLAITRILTEGNDPRKGDIYKLLMHLENETEWGISPASTKYHCSYGGGLIEHSVNVAETLIKMKKLFAPEISIESAAFVGLFHDIGKIGNYVIKEPTEKQKQYGYPGSIVYNDKISYMEHEHRSLKILSEYVHDISDDEWTAICYHNSPWNEDMHPRFRRCKLMTLLQYADYYSTVYLEEGGAH